MLIARDAVQGVAQGAAFARISVLERDIKSLQSLRRCCCIRDCNRRIDCGGWGTTQGDLRPPPLVRRRRRSARMGCCVEAAQPQQQPVDERPPPDPRVTARCHSCVQKDVLRRCRCSVQTPGGPARALNAGRARSLSMRMPRKGRADQTWLPPPPGRCCLFLCSRLSANVPCASGPLAVAVWALAETNTADESTSRRACCDDQAVRPRQRPCTQQSTPSPRHKVPPPRRSPRCACQGPTNACGAPYACPVPHTQHASFGARALASLDASAVHRSGGAGGGAGKKRRCERLRLPLSSFQSRMPHAHRPYIRASTQTEAFYNSACLCQQVCHFPLSYSTPQPKPKRV